MTSRILEGEVRTRLVVSAPFSLAEHWLTPRCAVFRLDQARAALLRLRTARQETTQRCRRPDRAVESGCSRDILWVMNVPRRQLLARPQPAGRQQCLLSGGRNSTFKADMGAKPSVRAVAAAPAHSSGKMRNDQPPPAAPDQHGALRRRHHPAQPCPV